MEKFFKLKEHGTDVRTEVTAGVTTFLAMVYILAVNPSILADSGMDSGAIFTATAVSAGFATLIMAFYANYPVALASGMGLNAYFSYSVCIPLANAGVQDPWKIALAAVLVEGIIFILLSFTEFREKLVNDIPMNLKYGITAGIGLFIVIVGLKSGGIIVSDSSTLVAMGTVSSPEFVLALLGVVVIAVLHHYNVKGDILIGILATWILGIVAQEIGWYHVGENASSLIPSLSGGFLPSGMNWFCFDFDWIASNIMEFVVIVFSFLFVDIFDTVGTLIGVANKGGLLDEDGKLPKAKQALLSDAVGTVAGACMGTSTVTSYVESSAGVAAGGRTGLTALTTGILFLISLLLSPIFLAIPSFATTPALVWVGLLMLSSVKNMTFDTEGDLADVVSGFMAIIMMPFTYSIANGIMFGMLSWVAIKVLTGKAKEVNGIMWVCFVLFALRIVTLIV